MNDCTENCDEPCETSFYIDSIPPWGMGPISPFTLLGGGAARPTNSKHIMMSGGYDVTITPLATTSAFNNCDVYIEVAFGYFSGSNYGQWGAPVWAYSGDGTNNLQPINVPVTTGVPII